MTSPRKILSRDSNYTVDVLMCTKYCRCAHVYKVWFIWEKLLQPQFYKDLTRKTALFEGCSWFRFNNLGLALGTILKFYASVTKGLTLKVRKFLGLNPCRSYRGKTGRGPFCFPPSWIEHYFLIHNCFN